MSPWLSAIGAALTASVLGVPVALGLWVARPGLRAVLGVMLVAAAGVAAAVALVAREPAVWSPAKGIAGLPVVVLAATARLCRIAPSSLRIAAVSGVSPAARFRLIVAPLMVPRLVAGVAVVFGAALAEALNPGQVAIGFVLPVAALVGWLAVGPR